MPQFLFEDVKFLGGLLHFGAITVAIISVFLGFDRINYEKEKFQKECCEHLEVLKRHALRLLKSVTPEIENQGLGAIKDFASSIEESKKDRVAAYALLLVVSEKSDSEVVRFCDKSALKKAKKAKRRLDLYSKGSPFKTFQIMFILNFCVFSVLCIVEIINLHFQIWIALSCFIGHLFSIVFVFSKVHDATRVKDSIEKADQVNKFVDAWDCSDRSKILAQLQSVPPV